MFTESKTDWSFLESLELSRVDLSIARLLLRPFPHAPIEAAAFICHMSMAARKGHLCVSESYPKVNFDGDTEIDPNQLKLFEELVQLGSKRVPEMEAICRDGERFYFQKHWNEETKFLERFEAFIQAKPICPIDAAQIEKDIEGQLLPEQKKAVIGCSKNVFSILCGGPGTGKTYTAGMLLKAISKQLPLDTKIALAAPTGKAAANLQLSLQKALQDHPWAKTLESKTLHSLLKIGRRGSEKVRIPADIVLVDECSMIDAKLMRQLFDSLKMGCRLILLGDPCQLPPVEAGSLFGDLITVLKGTPWEPFYLKKSLRAESEHIIHFAHAVNTGDVDEVQKKLKTEIPFQELTSLQTLFEQTKKYYEASPQEMLEQIQRFRILSPLRLGMWGVDYVNSYFLKQFTFRKNRRTPAAFPILIVGNDPQTELFNGELGVLVRMGSDTQIREGDYALFPGKKVPALLLPRFEYSYCLSVHKSQGSEFDHVLLLMPPGSEVFGRKVFYTGATRAKKKLEVWGSQDVISQTVALDFPRMSGLTSRLLLNS